MPQVSRGAHEQGCTLLAQDSNAGAKWLAEATQRARARAAETQSPSGLREEVQR